MSLFPVVPIAPGVPPLLRDPNAVIPAALTLLVADALTILGGFGQAQWGLFKNSVPVIVSDNVVSFDFKREWTVSDYPLEQGAFESYDKVAVPFDVRLRFSMGGSDADRQAFLDSIDAAANTLDLFDAVMPEKVYPSVNVTHYDYRRTATNGLGLLVVDAWCIQVRVTAQAAFTSAQQNNGTGVTSQNSMVGTGAFQAGNTQSPSGADPIGIGNVQPVTAPVQLATQPIL